jgi:hypothetical protein
LAGLPAAPRWPGPMPPPPRHGAAAAAGGQSEGRWQLPQATSCRRADCLRTSPVTAHCVRQVPEEVEPQLGAMKIVNEIGIIQNHQQTCR